MQTDGQKDGQTYEQTDISISNFPSKNKGGGELSARLAEHGILATKISNKSTTSHFGIFDS